MSRGRSALVVTMLAAMVAAPAWAAPPRAPTPGPAPTARSSSGELKGRVGVGYARHLLEADDPDDRIRGVVRLGAIGTNEAIDALVEVIEQGGPVARDLRARLEAVRALAPHAQRDSVRQVLLRETTDPGTNDARGGLLPLAPVVRGTAALALARSGDKKAVSGLVGAALQGGLAGE